MTLHYPILFASIRSWANEHRESIDVGRTRFAQYAILVGITSSSMLRNALVFKGGNALDFIWHPNRSTRDLDFSVDVNAIENSFDEHTLETALRQGLSISTRTLGVIFSVHRVTRQPPGIDKTFVTYEASIGYALEDETKLRQRMGYGQPSTHVIPVEVSINEPICDEAAIALDATHTLRVCTVEDIVAEKLRALLQQPLRNRTRRQDLLDIAVVLQSGMALDRSRIASFLLTKARARNVPVSRTAFRDPEIARRAAQDYGALENTIRTKYVPFDEALQSLLALIDDLSIPE